MDLSTSNNGSAQRTRLTDESAFVIPLYWKVVQR